MEKVGSRDDDSFEADSFRSWGQSQQGSGKGSCCKVLCILVVLLLAAAALLFVMWRMGTIEEITNTKPNDPITPTN